MNFFNLLFFNSSCFDCSLSFYQVFVIVWNSLWILKIVGHIGNDCPPYWNIATCLERRQFIFNIFLSTFSNERKILMFFLWLLFCIIYD
jgi:hypothetical protein